MKDTPRTVQIDYSLFLKMAAYITSHVDPYDSDLKEILASIRQKLAAIERRDAFTAFKTGNSPAECSSFYEEYQNLMAQIDALHL